MCPVPSGAAACVAAWALRVADSEEWSAAAMASARPRRGAEARGSCEESGSMYPLRNEEETQ